MRKTHSSVATVVVVSLLLIINLIAFNWTSKFFRHRYGVVLLQYGEQMPKLEGRGYSEEQTLFVSATKPTLILYLTGAGIKGQSIALLKFCESLSRQNESLFQTTIITSGLLPEIQQLLQDDLITHSIINDAEGQLARRLGLESGESGTFFFDKSGVCRFATRQQANPNDLRQLLATFVTGIDSADRPLLSKEKPLPLFSLFDARSRQRVTTEQLLRTDDQIWIFFVADCFVCGAPSPSHYLTQFRYWRQSAKDLRIEPTIVFDSAFLREDVAAELKRFAINSPAYVSNDDLSTLSHFLLAQGRRTDQPLMVRTNRSHVVKSIGLIEPPSRSSSDQPDDGAAKKETAPYTRIFQDLGLDVYDVASYNGLYYVSDRTRNSIVVVNERFEIQRLIGGIGSAPGRLFRPGYIDVSPEGLIYVQDGGNERIQCFALDGTYRGGFATKPYMGMAAGLNGEVYLGQPENGALVSVYSREGKRLRSFGKLKTYSELLGQEIQELDEQYALAANRVRLFVSRDGSTLVSFMLVPLIQKYSPDGKLAFEARLEGPEIDALRQTPGLLTMSMDGVPETILALEAVSLPGGEIDVVLTNGSIYVADENGRRQRVIQPQTDRGFTPEMTGTTPAGALLVIGLNPRNCLQVNNERERAIKGEL